MQKEIITAEADGQRTAADGYGVAINAAHCGSITINITAKIEGGELLELLERILKAAAKAR